MQTWIENSNKIPEWLTLGRTVLVPKAGDLSSKKHCRPITCLKTSNKNLTRTLEQYVKKHNVQNCLWDKSHMRTCKKVPGTVDQILIDNPIMGDVRDHHRNLTVTYYDYQKAYNRSIIPRC